MQIGGIKFRNVSDDTNFTWKFNRKGGSCPSISAIKADKGTFSSIRNAISYAITGAKVGSVEYVVLHLLDDNGDSWVIERSTKKFRVFKNRQLIENDLKKTSLGTILDLDLKDSSSAKNIFGDWYVTEYDSEVRIIRKDLLDNDLLSFSGKLLDKKNYFLEAMRKFIGKSKLDDLQIISFGRKIKPIYDQNLINQKTEKTLQDAVDRNIPVVSQRVEQIESELELLQKVSDLAPKLFDSVSCYSKRKKQLDAIDKKLQVLCKSSNIKKLPIKELGHSWESILESFSRYRVYEKLEKTTSSALEYLRSNSSDSYLQFHDLMLKFLHQDHKIVEELESGLKLVSDHVHSLSEKTAPSKQKNWAQKLFLIDDEVNDDELLNEFVESKERLELCRSAVNSTLTKLGELYGSIEDFQEEFSDINADMDLYCKRIESESKKLKVSWINISKDLDIDTNISIESLLGYMNTRSKICHLSSKRETLRAEILTFKDILSQAESLIYEWRRLRGSMKEDKVERVSVIVTEFRSILAYKESKLKERDLVNQINYKTSVNKNIECQIHEINSSLSNLWDKTFKEYSVRKISVDHIGWEKFFTNLHKLEALKEFMEDSSPEFSVDWEKLCFEFPISFFFVEGVSAENIDALFLSKVMSNVDQTHSIIAFDDVSYERALEEKNIIVGNKQVAKLAQPNTDIKKTPRKTVLNESAHEALGMFKSRD